MACSSDVGEKGELTGTGLGNNLLDGAVQGLDSARGHLDLPRGRDNGVALQGVLCDRVNGLGLGNGRYEEDEGGSAHVGGDWDVKVGMKVGRCGCEVEDARDVDDDDDGDGDDTYFLS